MKNGVFTEIIYTTSRNAVGDIPRTLLLVGPPLYALNVENRNSIWTGLMTVGGTTVIGADHNTDTWDLLKPYADCHLFHLDNMDLYAKDSADPNADPVLLTSGTEYVFTDKDHYNDGVAAVITITHNAVRSLLGVAIGAVVEIYASLIVSRTTLYNKKIPIRSATDIENNFGRDSMDTHDSVLGFCSGLALIELGARFDVYCVDMTDYEGNDPTGYLMDHAVHDSIIDKLRRFSNYYLVPLIKMADYGETEKGDYQTIIAKYKAHVVSQSSKDEKKECRVYIAKPVMNEGEGLDYGGIGFFTEYPNSAFKGEQSYIDQAEDDVAVAVNYPPTIKSDRVVLIGDYYAITTIGMEGQVSEVLEGCEIATLVAAKRARVPLGYKMTNGPISGIITRVPHYGYFSEQHCVALRNAGWYMIFQDTENSLPICFHQVTTDNGILEQFEESLPIIMDAYAMDLRETIKDMIANGTVNYVSQDPNSKVFIRYISRLNQMATPLNNRYKEKKWLASVAITSVVPNTIYRDQADVIIRATHYYPLNHANITIRVI